MSSLGFESDEGFPFRDALPTLDLGGKRYTFSRYSGDGTSRRIRFFVPVAEYQALPHGAAMAVANGARVQAFGRLP